MRSLTMMRSAMVLAVALAASLAACGADAPREEKLAGRWVLQLVSPKGIHGRHSRYLGRTGPGATRRVTGEVLEARYVEDDCVIYSGYDRGLYTVCGDRLPVFIASLGRDFGDIRTEVIQAGNRQFTLPELKGAAQNISVEPVGGSWTAQPEALPGPSDAARARFILFRDDQLGRYPATIPALAYRYLEEDCLLVVYDETMLILTDPHGKAKGNFPAAVVCGRRDQIDLGTVERPSDISAGDEIRIEGELRRVSALKQQALAQPER